MASNATYDSGVITFQVLATDPSHPLEEGDLCGTATVAGKLTAEPASYFSTAAAFAAAFAGVAMRKTGLQAGEASFCLPLVVDPGYTLVAVSGNFRYPCASGIAWQPGSLVAIAVASGAGLNQQVALAANYTTAIGVAQVAASLLGSTAATTIVFSLRSDLSHAGVLSGQ